MQPSPVPVEARLPAKSAGRPASPATLKLREAMGQDQAAGQVRTRAAYLTLLRDAGGPSSANAAGIIVNREAKRIFGAPLSRIARRPKQPKGRPGRKPGPAAFAVQVAMEADAASHRHRTRHEYLQMLKDAGFNGSEANASAIVRREAKRAFGHALGRAKTKRRARAGSVNGRLQQRKEAVAVLRSKLQEDAAKDDVRVPSYYVKWLVDQPNVGMGLRQARPMVYRELKPHRKAPEPQPPAIEA